MIMITLLTLISMFGNIRHSAPHVSYITYMDYCKRITQQCSQLTPPTLIQKHLVIDWFLFTGFEEVLGKASNNIIIMDIVLLADLLFKEEIHNGELFKDLELTELLFPGPAMFIWNFY